MRILVIEDDDKIASFIQKGLQQAGMAVDHAAEGQEGLELALSTKYDAAIVDMMLPRLDGLSIIQRLREKKVLTPVVILSALRSVDDRVKGLQTGGDDYLVKPFSFSELLARVQAVIRRSNGIAEAHTLKVGDLSVDLLTREVTRGEQRMSCNPGVFAPGVPHEECRSRCVKGNDPGACLGLSLRSANQRCGCTCLQAAKQNR